MRQLSSIKASRGAQLKMSFTVFFKPLHFKTCKCIIGARWLFL